QHLPVVGGRSSGCRRLLRVQGWPRRAGAERQRLWSSTAGGSWRQHRSQGQEPPHRSADHHGHPGFRSDGPPGRAGPASLVTRLASLLDHPDALLAALRVRAPELTLLPRAVAKISGEAHHIEREPTEALQRRVADLIAGDGVSTLSRSDLRESCRTFLHPPHAPARDLEVAKPLCDEVERLQRRSAFFALLDAYLDGF